jgi:hypothetical protein
MDNLQKRGPANNRPLVEKCRALALPPLLDDKRHLLPLRLDDGYPVLGCQIPVALHLRHLLDDDVGKFAQLRPARDLGTLG